MANPITEFAVKSELNNESESVGTTSKSGSFSNISSRSSSSFEDVETGFCVLFHKVRFTILIISTLCLTSVLSNILTFNFAVICMKTDNEESVNVTDTDEHYLYSPLQESLIFMSVAVGSIASVFPIALALNKFGSRRVFSTLGFQSSLATLLIPLAVSTNFYLVLFLRVLQGISFAACLPVMGSVTSHWSTLKQAGVFQAVLSGFLQLAPVFTNPVSGELCQSRFGWPSIFYVHGIVSAILFTIYMLYHRGGPHKHPLVGKVEHKKITHGKSLNKDLPSHVVVSKKIPFCEIYRDKAIWAILVSAFGNFLGTQLSLQYIPMYIKEVLKQPTEITGLLAAISPILMFFLKFAAGQASDKIKFLSDRRKLQVFNSLAVGGMAVLLILLGFLHPEHQTVLCLVNLIAATCILGFNTGGFFKSSQMISRQHSHFTLANIAFINATCMLLIPALVELLASDNSPGSWSNVFWCIGTVMFSANVFFCVFASSDAAPWTVERISKKTQVHPETQITSVTVLDKASVQS